MQLALIPGCNAIELREHQKLDKTAWQLKKTINDSRISSLSDGSSLSVDLTFTPVFDDKKNPYRLCISGKPLQAYKQEESNKEITDREITDFNLLTTLFDSSHLSFAILDGALRITRVNAEFSSFTGYSIEELRNQGISFIKRGRTDSKIEATILDYFQSQKFQLWSGDFNCKKSNGFKYTAKLQIKPLKNKTHSLNQFFVTLIDISQYKLNEKRILQIAHYDDLTGLPNRVMFLERMEQVISYAGRHDLHAVIFFIDLDKFKSVNDSLGHDAGDEVLKETAKRLTTSTRKEDIVARFSGDEFAILLLHEKSHEQAIFSSSLIADKIIKSLSDVHLINRTEVFIGASIGIAIYPEDGKSSTMLLKNADIAMYEAKNKGRDNYQYYKSEFSHASQDKLTLESNLRKALAKNELQLFYQPQYKANNRKLWGAEVLIRWFYDSNGINKMIPPDHFIPIAEETGLIIEIGAWILETACLQLKSWIDAGLPLKQVSVNVSARQFMDDGFMKSVEDALAKAQLPARNLELEITESMLIGDINRIELQLKRLKKMGIKIALDDFGTGYSSLSYLKKFPIDVLKIDQSFIRDMTSDSKDARIACAIIDMGHSLGQKVVAEGVEDETQLIFLNKRKCDIIQGYFFSRPLPVSDMTILLKSLVADS
ncbi:MAG: EAL domain-containing protein [Methyloprofundus sp.]|nr:EAL domain-containing protein [Methyloprofundus sp.]